jgi:hypothetical protein
MTRSWICLGLLLALAGCKPTEDDGLALQASVVVSAPGAEERRLEIFEDARITPTLRPVMWGARKDPPALAASILKQPLQRAAIRLVDRQGTVLSEHRLDCELGAAAPMQQGDGKVWSLIDDCGTGEGDYAGLITYFFTLAGDRLVFQSVIDKPSDRAALTLVQARRIDWRSDSPGHADTVREVSSHPDFDDPRVKALKDGEPMPADLPLVTDFIRYRYDGDGQWVKRVRTDRHLAWSAADGFPADSAFPE